MFFKKRQEKPFFNNIYVPLIIFIFLILFQKIGIQYIKLLMLIMIPILTIPILYFKLKNRNVEKPWKIIFTIFLIEIVVCTGILYKGFPILPFGVAPINNLYFWGILITLCSKYYLLTKEKGNLEEIPLKMKRLKVFLIGLWSLIILYQYLM
ncbi:MAG: hypothetical protein SOW67_03860 [Fusobacterium necrophorum]|nr:hypothetical protein [Fusobacterium necrophorum]